jgi:hypothetical protein
MAAYCHGYFVFDLNYISLKKGVQSFFKKLFGTYQVDLLDYWEQSKRG